MRYGGEEVVLNKIERLKNYLSEGLPRYQDILEQQNRTMPKAPEGIEYKSPGIMESQIFTVLTKRFKSRKVKFFKIWSNLFSENMCSKSARRNCRSRENRRSSISR